MAVERTGAIYKSLFFDEEDSRDYGVYITGQAVYNAPEREVEMIPIPGRNGALALDKGRFENIEVTYPAGIYADTEADFAEAISNFRNLLCSRRGYVRLQDEYNPNEYRMAIYKSGLEVEPALLRAGEFEIIFDCKPQRYLTSGEEPITIGEWRDTETVTGDIVQIDNSRDVLAVKSLSVSLEPIQSGSGTPSPDNIRPISGRTECDTEVVGKNLCDVPDASYNHFIAKVKSGVTYTFSATIRTDGGFNLRKNSQSGAVVKNVNGQVGRLSTSFTADDDYDLWVNAWVGLYDIQLEVGTTATDYEPYNGQTYTTDLGRTVYGGTLEQVGGSLTETMGKITADDFNYFTVNPLSSGGLCHAEASASVALGAYAISSMLEWKSWADAGASTTDCFTTAGSRIVVYTSETSLSDFKTKYAELTVVYELRTPQTYQLSGQDIELITGHNNIWSDGGSTTLEYGTAPNVLINPTLFESSPLLEVEGHGSIRFNNYRITVQDTNFGDIVLNPSVNKTFQYGNVQYWVPADSENAYSGDTIRVDKIVFNINSSIPNPVVDHWTVNGGNPAYDCAISGNKITITIENVEFSFGTYDTVDCVAYFDTDRGFKGIGLNASYQRGDNGDEIAIYLEGDYMSEGSGASSTVTVSPIILHSTKAIIEGGYFLDCDLGEAYKIEDGQAVSLNAYIDLGSDLPTLASGANSITADNTITDLKVTPRWWKI